MALTPEERHAINDLFERLQANSPADKDAEAEALINQLMRRTPDSAYILVQTTLVQEAHIEDLEARISELEAQLAGNSRAPSRGGFLGGARRGAAPRDDHAENRRSGIPPVGSRSQQSTYEPSPQPGWQGSRDAPANARPSAPSQPQSGGGGGFFRTAAAMAAGVAGGTLLANSLGGMFGGKSGDAQAGQDASTSHDSGHHDASDNDPGNYDADYHDAGVEEGDWGAGMDDIDI